MFKMYLGMKQMEEIMRFRFNGLVQRNLAM
jgi:hypothetical protein